MLKLTFKKLVLAVVAATVLPTAALAEPYRITIETRNDAYAGTDGYVFIVLKGQYGTQKFEFDPPGNSFERGHWDTGMVDLPQDLGTLRSMTLELMAHGDDSEWTVASAYVTNMNTGERADFSFNETIGYVLDGHLAREVFIDKETRNPIRRLTYSLRQLGNERVSTQRAIRRQRNR